MSKEKHLTEKLLISDFFGGWSALSTVDFKGYLGGSPGKDTKCPLWKISDLVFSMVKTSKFLPGATEFSPAEKCLNATLALRPSKFF